MWFKYLNSALKFNFNGQAANLSCICVSFICNFQSPGSLGTFSFKGSKFKGIYLIVGCFNFISSSAHANVEAAWKLSNGTGTIIAIIDDGVDLDHEEFRSSGKIVAPRYVTRKSDNPRPGNDNNHGTGCAGVACANGNFGASGVAPGAKLMPIRLASAMSKMAIPVFADALTK